MYQEDAEALDHRRQLLDAEDDKRRNGTGFVCEPIPGEWIEESDEEREQRERAWAADRAMVAAMEGEGLL